MTWVLSSDIKDFGPYFKVLKPFRNEDIPRSLMTKWPMSFSVKKNKTQRCPMDVLLASYLLDPSRNDLTLKSLIYENFGLVVAEEEPARSLNLLEGMYQLKDVVAPKLRPMVSLSFIRK